MSKQEKPLPDPHAKPIAMGVERNLWTFTYKVGPAPKTGVVEGATEDEGYRVACRWCEIQGFRSPASVQAMILAGPSILKVKNPAEIDGLVGRMRT